ncbi:hypothetical protein NPIL_653681, partial [Nephila pilipes]
KLPKISRYEFQHMAEPGVKGEVDGGVDLKICGYPAGVNPRLAFVGK